MMWSQREYCVKLDLIPDNQGIIAILNNAIEGPYRFVHNALMPYVRVAPATETEPITIRSSPGLRLMLPEAEVKHLSGRDAVLDFAVMFSGSGEMLQELGRRAVMLDSIDPQHPLSHRPLPARGVPRRSFTLGTPRAVDVPEGGAPSRPPKPSPSAVPARKRLVVDPEPPVPVSFDAPVPELIDTVRCAEDIQPDLGDYLVIPEQSVPHDEPLPPWVVRSPHVQVMHVHKRRLDKHYALMPAIQE